MQCSEIHHKLENTMVCKRIIKANKVMHHFSQILYGDKCQHQMCQKAEAEKRRVTCQIKSLQFLTA